MRATISEHGHLHICFVFRVRGKYLKNGQKESYYCFIETSTLLMEGYAQILAGEKSRLRRHRLISDAGLLRNELRYMCRTCFYAYNTILKAQKVCFTVF